MKFLSYTYPGLEKVLKKELLKRKVQIDKVEDGQITYFGDETTLVKANLWLRTANKVYIVLAEQKITNFDKLFDFVYSINWKFYLTDKFYPQLKVVSHKSALSHIPSISSIVSKAIFSKLSQGKLDLSTIQAVEIRIDIYKDNVKILLDTSGVPLYQRGYKQFNSKASLKATLAAGLIMLVDSKFNDFVDPFCGSATILIEYALWKLNIAPGIFRNFIFEKFDWIDKNLLEKEKRRAKTRQKKIDLIVKGYDIDGKVLVGASQNVKNAGLENYIKLEKKNYLDLKLNFSSCIINPPYDKRLSADEKIYKKLLKDFDSIKQGGILTSFPNLSEKFYKNFKVRVLSNGGERVKFFYK